jgi:hypothetical protein
LTAKLNPRNLTAATLAVAAVPLSFAGISGASATTASDHPSPSAGNGDAVVKIMKSHAWDWFSEGEFAKITITGSDGISKTFRNVSEKDLRDGLVAAQVPISASGDIHYTISTTESDRGFDDHASESAIGTEAVDGRWTRWVGGNGRSFLVQEIRATALTEAQAAEYVAIRDAIQAEFHSIEWQEQPLLNQLFETTHEAEAARNAYLTQLDGLERRINQWASDTGWMDPQSVHFQLDQVQNLREWASSAHLLVK